MGDHADDAVFEALELQEQVDKYLFGEMDSQQALENGLIDEFGVLLSPHPWPESPPRIEAPSTTKAEKIWRRMRKEGGRRGSET